MRREYVDDGGVMKEECCGGGGGDDVCVWRNVLFVCDDLWRWRVWMRGEMMFMRF